MRSNGVRAANGQSSKLVAMQRFVLFFVLLTAANAARQPFTTEDLRGWRTAAEARIRPDGRWVVYLETEGERATLWLASTDGKERRRYTYGAWHDSSPRWSPDGERIAWISDRGGKPNLRVRKWDAPLETALETAVPSSFSWSPEGDALAFTAAVEPEPVAAWAPPAILERLRKPESVAQIFVVPSAGGP